MSGKYNFPKLQKIILRNFSLYTKNDQIHVIEEKIYDGVFCLAGANGLGKTTFLNIINYCFTGLVLESTKDFKSPSEIEISNKDYTDRYFIGRIKDKDKAEVEIFFNINKKTYRLTRGFNDRKALKLLEIYDEQNNSLLNFNNQSPKELNDLYEKNLTNDIGIGKFEYFTFIQLYILTFDESRRMLFWNEKASTYALSIAFMNNFDDTSRISELMREMETLESYGRNARWQATQIKNEMDILIRNQKEKKLINFNELKKEYEQLIINTEKSEQTMHNVAIEYDTLLKRQNILNSELLQIKIKYKKLFSQYAEPRSKLLDNQYIKFSINQSECFLCGAKGHNIIEHITRNLHQDKCPVCDTAINNDTSNEQEILLKQLEDYDKTIEKKNTEIENLIFDSDVKKVQLEQAEYEYYSSKEKLERFEKENSQIRFKETGDIPTDTLITQYQERFEKEDKKSKDYYKQRDNLLPEYDNLLTKVNEAYKDAEEHFVPLFKLLAKSFIGLDLNIHFLQKSKNILLKFDLLGKARTESFQLSESQRFFLDIALRMALLIYMSKQNNEATMLIDTPEGSLDIAYESRVGKMFADFVVDYHQNIIMTANINASQLLVSLADKCKHEKMYFKRMLDWTDMTDIQKEGEHLFDKVYNNIEEILRS